MQIFKRKYFKYIETLIFLFLIITIQVNAAYVTRYSTIAKGAMTFTGNTLGLDKVSNQNNPGTAGSIGTFTTTDTTLKVGTYPSGTTLNYLLNSSSATLVMPAGSTVLYAELIWGGSYKYGTQDVTGALNNAVTLITPISTYSVTPASASAKTLPGATNGGQYYYVRSADVTAYVKSAGAGVYTVGKVPATDIASENSANAAGWTLAVVYGNSALSAQNMTVFVGCELTDSTTSTLSSVSGFCTPKIGPISARMLVTAIEGDSSITGDQMQFGPTTTTMSAISGPNNPVSNFFSSQINKDNGTLDTSGTFGTRNHPLNGSSSGARQGWDITNVDVSARMTNNQTTAYAKGTTTGDRYTIIGIGLQINIGAPVFPTNTMTVDKATAYVGDTLTYSVTLDNTAGTADAINTVLKSALPSGLDFVNGSVTVGGVAQPAASAISGINIGTVAIGSKIVVTYKMKVSAIPLSPLTAQYVNNATWTYQYQSSPTLPLNNGTLTTSPNTITLIPRLETSKTASPPGGVVSGTTVTYTITVSNTGTANTTGTTFYDPMPQGVDYIVGTTKLNGITVADIAGNMPYATPGMISSPGKVAGQIYSGETATISFQVKTNNNTPPGGIITNIATIDPDGAGIAPSQQAIVTNPPQMADISVVVSDGQTIAIAGSNITYLASITNNGPNTIYGMTLSATPSSEITFTAFTPSSGTYNSSTNAWTGINLPVGGSITMAIIAKVSGLAIGPITTNVSVLTQPGIVDSNQTNNSSNDSDNIQYIADLAVAKTDGKTNILPGDKITYTITVTNNGPSTVSDIFLVDALPASLTTPVYTPDLGVYNIGNGAWNGLVLATGGTAKLTLTAFVAGSATGNIVNSVTVSPSADFTDNITTNNTSTDTDVIGNPGNSISGTVYEDINHNGSLDQYETGTSITGLFAKLILSTGGNAIQAVTVDPLTGFYSFSNVNNGIYTVIISNNSTITNTQPAQLTGWINTEAANLTRTNIIIQNVALPNQHFGLWHGGKLSGEVFSDNGQLGGIPNDGTKNGGETGISTVTMQLINGNTSVIYDSCITDNLGKYTLWIPFIAGNGSLNVTESNPTGTISIGANSGTTGGVYNRNSDTITFTNLTGTTYTGVNFSDVPANQFMIDNSQTVTAGSVIFYTHSFVAGSGGVVTFSTQHLSSPTSANWSNIIYLDQNGNGIIDNNDSVINGPLTVTASEQPVQIIIKEFAPTNATDNAQDLITVRADFVYTNTTPTLTSSYYHTDLTTISTSAGMKIIKTVDKTYAKPGEILLYTINYSNISAETLKNITISDATPAFTVFVSAGYNTFPLNITSCNMDTPVVNETGPILWKFTGTLAPFATGTVNYRVKIQ